MAAVLALLVVSLVAGVAARRLPMFPESTPAALAAVILNVALPALVIRILHDVTLSAPMAVGALMLWGQFLLALGFFSMLRKWVRLTREAFGALVLTAGLSNTAFVGLPVIEVALGRAALGPAIIVDQLGSFLVMATVGITFALSVSGLGQRTSAAQLLRKVTLFPPFVALLLGLLLRTVELPAWLMSTLDRLGAILTPLALFTVGFQLRLSGIAGRGRELALGLGFKLVLAPLIIGALMTLAAPPTALEWKVVVLQAAMPPMVTGAILATEHRLDPPLAAAMLGVGLPVSALTLGAVISLIT